MKLIGNKYLQWEKGQENVNVIYVSLCCAQKRFNELMKEIRNPVQSDQKLHTLLLRGMAQHVDTEVNAVSALPVNRSNYMRKYTPSEHLVEKGCNYFHLASLNVPVLCNAYNFIQSFLEVCRLGKANKKDSVVICDILKLSIASGALLASKLLGIKSIGIVTDVPRKRPNKGNLLYRIIDRLRYVQLNAYDAYVFLTEQMNGLINHGGKPYVVIEGAVDKEMAQIPNILEEKNEPQICVYSGSIHRVYGIQALVEGFIVAGLSDIELWIYGDGDYRKDLEALCETHSNIRYFGVVPNHEVIKTQIRASLLINPRPPVGEYTKYSFPSKNMEYMVSGTPLLATKLPGMPDEYIPYIYELKDYTSTGISTALQQIFGTSPSSMHEKGALAKKFVLEQKNHVIQSQKIIDLVLTCCNTQKV